MGNELSANMAVWLYLRGRERERIFLRKDDGWNVPVLLKESCKISSNMNVLLIDYRSAK
jgi:hypothetical protein